LIAGRVVGPIAALTLVLLSAIAVALTSTGEAATPASGTITPSSGPITWQGESYAAGANVSNTAGEQLCPGDSGAVPGVHECDVFELTVDVPPGHWGTNKGGVRVDITWANDPGEDNDFDMYIFKKPAPGEPLGNPVASSAQGGTTEEHALIFSPEGTYLVRVNPFAVTTQDYEGKVEFFNLDPIPDVPGGVDQYRASSSGYLSYSEPHIAVNPLNPHHLVAGSKMYQNLPAYKFKIGTFVSFDGGQTWQDQGHLPGYPSQTGDEGDDYHITSDVWMAFDDEGNAYTMVLDSPPDSQVTGAGWGMNLHKSTDGGQTWSDPIPIEAKEDPVTKELLLSDKNTMTVDNFGPDQDGETGNMYACWSEDAPVANLFVALSRSTDAGQTWSEGIDVSGADRTVIGCFVLVGPPTAPGEPGILYVFWLDFAGDGRIRMAKSTNGGQTFSSPSTVANIHQVPRLFPNSAFRNLSIPWAAADPNDGTVYISWADYHNTTPDEACPEGDDPPAPGQVCDAEILMVRSDDEGATWSDPIRINQDPIGNGKDQFQQALEVTPSGQLNAMWFDRRNDPQNFYIDTFFARSNDQGDTWTETRVTRSMWDPSINPPISPSGHFIGDYQGLAVNDCFAYPFWQDTTLANLPVSDPAYSPYQEAFSARIPNTAEFGGEPVAGVDCELPAAGSPGPPEGPLGDQPPGKCSVERKGTPKDDKMKGTAESDLLRGKGGDDGLKGKGGDDCLRGGRGGDKVKGGSGGDELNAGPGGDKMLGGGGADLIKARAGGADVVRCGKGKDKVLAGPKDELHGCEKVV
jgi:hypothetical protein